MYLNKTTYSHLSFGSESNRLTNDLKLFSKKDTSHKTNNIKKLSLILFFIGLIITSLSAQAQVGGIQPDGVGGGAPGKPGAISGPTSISPGTTTSSYSTTTASGATSYSWSLSPSSAGSISGSSTSATVTWNSSYAGSVGVYVSGVNTSGMGTPSILTVTVIAPLVPSVVSPSTQNIEYNSSPSLTASASSGGTGTYNYQWQSSTDQSTWTNYGAAGLTFPTGNLTSNTYFRMQTISGTQTANSNFATITVSPLLTGVNISPANQSVNYGSSPATLTATPVGGSGNFTSSIWQSSTDGVNWGKSLGTGLTYPPPANNTSLIYQITLTTSTNVTVHNTTAVNFYPQLQAPTILSATTSINYNTSPTITSPEPQGGSGSYTNQWQSSPNGSSWTNVGSSFSTTTSTGTITMPTDNITANTYFQLVSSSNGSANVTSNQIYVTVYPQLVCGVVTNGSQTINYSASPAALTVTSATGGNGTIFYQWQSSPTGTVGSYTNVTGGTGATTTTYSPGPLTSTTYYQLVASSGNPLVNAPSSPITITVYPQFVTGSITQGSQTISYGATPTLNMIANPPTGGSGTYTYQWQFSTDGTNWPSVSLGTGTSSGTGLTYTVPSGLTVTTYYRLVSTSNGVNAYSGYATVTVYPQIAPGTIAAQSINYNTAPSFSVQASGGNSSYSYQLMTCPTSTGTFVASGSAVAGTNTAVTVTGASLTTSAYFELATTSYGQTVTTTTPVLVTVYPQLSQNAIAAQSINYNTAPSYSVLASGGNNSYSYQLMTSPTINGTYTSTGLAIAGGNTTAVTVSSVAITTSAYFELATTSHGVTVTTAPVLVTVYPQLNPGTLTAQSINYNTAPSFTISASGGNNSYSYQLMTSATIGGTYTPVGSVVAGTNTASVSLTGTAITTTAYFEVATTSNNLTINTAPVSVTVYPQLISGAVTPATQSIAPNTIPSTITSAPPRGGNGTYLLQWQSSSDNINFSNVNGATTLSYTPTTAVTSNIYYRLIIISNGVTAINNTSAVIVTDCLMLNSNLSTTMNYIVTATPRIAGMTTATALANQTACNLEQVVEYFDGLGRPIQTVEVKASPTGRDVVQPMAYDQFDREAVNYMPYVVALSSPSDGSYKTTAIADQSSFYSAPTTAGTWDALGVVQTSFPTANVSFEPSPLNRMVERGSAGDAWQLTGTAGAANPGHTNKIIYAANNATSLTTGTGYWAKNYGVTSLYTTQGAYLYKTSLADNGSYPVDVLFVTVTQNENWLSTQSNPKWNTTEEYKDKLGRMLLKRTYNYNTTVTPAITETLSTYYVYDEYNNLVYVLPPGANPDAGNISQTTLDMWCYQYRYDGRNRLIGRKVPGKGWDLILYNLLDQAVAHQDSTQRMKSPQEFTITKYDAMGRVVIQGVYQYSGSTSGTDYRATLQSLVDAQTAPWESVTTTGNGYTANTWPTMWTTTLSLSYYDNYSGVPGGLPYTFGNGSAMTRGQLTAFKIAILNAPSNMLWTQQYYDDQNRLTKQFEQHYLGGVASLNNYDDIINIYDFTGAITSTTRKHYINGSGNSLVLNVTVNDSLVYDQTGRQIQNWDQVNANPKVLVVQNNFNETGEPLSKQLHSLTGHAFLQTVDYRYNTRGWLTSINNASLNSDGGITNNDNNDEFGEELSYDGTTTSPPQYNSNISTIKWKSVQGSSMSSAPPQRAYDFRYDNMNRLTEAVSSTTGTKDGNYNEYASYSTMGNIQTLGRYALLSGVKTHIDSLTYTYTGNQHTEIDDNTGNTAGFTDGVQQANEYLYDSNGNVTQDLNKGITSIVYNMLNLPQVITTGSGTITFTYDANGRKLRKVSTINGVTSDYINGIQYTNNAMGLIETEEGRININLSTNSYSYEYDIKDHLGSPRVSFIPSSSDPTQQTLQTVQENSYYPFGLTMQGDGTVNYVSGSQNNYQFNKRELQTDLNQYDFGSRLYDPAIGRWGVVDPMAGVAKSESPYSYAGNSPTNYIDHDGQFKISATLAQKYPTLAKMLKYFLPQLAQNAQIKEAFKELTNFTDAEFKEMVTYGKGPNVIDGMDDSSDPSGWMHQNDPHYSNKNRFKDELPDNIYIAASELKDLEKAWKKANKTHDYKDLQFQMFKVSLLIIHESTHRGVYLKGNPRSKRFDADPNDDAGAEWEQLAFGRRFSYNLNNVSDAIDDSDLRNFLNKNFNYIMGQGLNPGGNGELQLLFKPTYQFPVWTPPDGAGPPIIH